MADPVHVKIPDARPRNEYIADGYQTTFPFTFPLMDETHLAVYLNDARESSGFDVLGERETDGGVVFFSQAPAADTVVTLVRDVPIERMSDFQENVAIQTRVLNDEFDVFTTALQDLAEGVRRSISLKATDTDANLHLPSKDERANKLLGFDGDGNAITTTMSVGEGKAADPGGSDTQVQFNDGGLFGGSGGFTYKKATNTLCVAGGVNTDVLNEKTNDAGVTVEGILIKDAHIDGRSLSLDGSKLDSIEVGAAADQTGAEIKVLYEGEADTNVFTDSEKAKLAGIETGASADMTAAEIKKAYEGEADTNAFTDSEKAKLGGIETGATADMSGAEIKKSYEGEVDTNAFTDFEKAKLAGIETGASADMTGAEIKKAYEGETDTNAFTDSEKVKLAGIETGASADMTGAEIKKTYEGEADTNAFTDSEKAKLAAIEAGATADQTGSQIVSAINSELGGTTWQKGGGGGTSNGASIIPLQVPTFADLASPPKYKYINGIPLQFFEVGDAVKWPVHMPEEFGPSPVLKVLVAMETANSGTLSLAASVDAISPKDTQIVSKESYDAANKAVVTVPSAPETIMEVPILLTSSDNLSAGDIARLKLERSTGTAPGGMWLLSAALTSAS